MADMWKICFKWAHSLLTALWWTLLFKMGQMGHYCLSFHTLSLMKIE